MELKPFVKGLISKKVDLDGREMYSDNFYWHENGHIGTEDALALWWNITKEQKLNLRRNYLNFRESVPIANDKRQPFEFSYLGMTHENCTMYRFFGKADTHVFSSAQPELVELLQDPKWFVDVVPDWARKSDSAAKRFLRIADEEMKAFLNRFYPEK